MRRFKIHSVLTRTVHLVPVAAARRRNDRIGYRENPLPKRRENSVRACFRWPIRVIEIRGLVNRKYARIRICRRGTHKCFI